MNEQPDHEVPTEPQPLLRTETLRRAFQRGVCEGLAFVLSAVIMLGPDLLRDLQSVVYLALSFFSDPCSLLIRFR